MNNIIELQDKRTWTKELKDSIRKARFNNIIKQYNIVGYHYTNLINIKDIFENGLNTLCNRSIRKIIENITSRYPDKNDILEKKLLLGLGEPYIIKFIYNFDDLDLWVMDDLKQQMTDKLLKNKNIELDFSKEKGIKSEEILGAIFLQVTNSLVLFLKVLYIIYC